MPNCPICGEKNVRYVHHGGDAHGRTEAAPEGTITLSCRCSMPEGRWLDAGGAVPADDAPDRPVGWSMTHTEVCPDPNDPAASYTIPRLEGMMEAEDRATLKAIRETVASLDSSKCSICGEDPAGCPHVGQPQAVAKRAEELKQHALAFIGTACTEEKAAPVAAKMLREMVGTGYYDGEGDALLTAMAAWLEQGNNIVVLGRVESFTPTEKRTVEPIREIGGMPDGGFVPGKAAGTVPLKEGWQEGPWDIPVLTGAEAVRRRPGFYGLTEEEAEAMPEGELEALAKAKCKALHEGTPFPKMRGHTPMVEDESVAAALEKAQEDAHLFDQFPKREDTE